MTACIAVRAREVPFRTESSPSVVGGWNLFGHKLNSRRFE